ncbi:Leucine-rich repeat extensin-like protein 4 [Linum grandiflorum]
MSLSFLLSNHISAVTLAATVGIGNAGGTAGVWIGGGVTTVSPPPHLDAAYSALQSWKSAISADPSRILDIWVDPNVCFKKGISGNNQFSGNFPIPVLYIPNLLYLDLRFNSFTGPIPDDLFDKRLDAIFLNNNQFQGSTPQNLGNSSAFVINLGYNNLTGNILRF